MYYNSYYHKHCLSPPLSPLSSLYLLAAAFLRALLRPGEGAATDVVLLVDDGVAALREGVVAEGVEGVRDLRLREGVVAEGRAGRVVASLPLTSS